MYPVVLANLRPLNGRIRKDSTGPAQLVRFEMKSSLRTIAYHVLGPVLVSASVITDPSSLHLRGLHNGEAVQDCGLE